MASSKEYLDFVLEQLSELDDISYRAMMGEYIIYYRGKVVGGIYDACEIIGLSRKSLINQGLQLESYFLDQLNGTQTLPDENLCSAA